MKLRNIFAAGAALSLAVAPTLAAAQTAPQVAPASETLGSDEQQIYGASVILQLGIALALAAVIYFGLKALDGDDEPASP
jgi:hypothetical protein